MTEEEKHYYYVQVLYNEDSTDLFLIYQNHGRIQGVVSKTCDGLVNSEDIDRELKDKLGVERKENWNLAFIKDYENNLIGSNLCPVKFFNKGRFMVSDWSSVVEYKRKMPDDLL